jgi:hypothetical protein
MERIEPGRLTASDDLRISRPRLSREMTVECALTLKTVAARSCGSLQCLSVNMATSEVGTAILQILDRDGEILDSRGIAPGLPSQTVKGALDSLAGREVSQIDVGVKLILIQRIDDHLQTPCQRGLGPDSRGSGIRQIWFTRVSVLDSSRRGRS